MDRSFRETLELAKADDPQAKAALIEQFGSVIEQACRNFGLSNYPDWSRADLAQEATNHILTRLDRFQSSGTELVFANWLRSTTRNFVIDLLRKRQSTLRHPAQPILNLDPAGDGLPDRKGRTPSSIVANRESMEKVRRAMDSLDDVSRSVLQMNVLDGLSQSETGRRLGLTREQVRNRLEHALQRVARHLSYPPGDLPPNST